MEKPGKSIILATVALALTVCALGVAASLGMREAAARGPDCPASWPEAEHSGLHTDSEGKGWFIIRSADSNGYHVVRAYPASDRYAAGYVAGSPDEVCYLSVRGPGAAADAEEPRQVIFPKEREAPEERAPASAPLTLRQLLSRLSPADRQAAILCLLPISGGRTLDELDNDPEFLQQAIAAGCLSQ